MRSSRATRYVLATWTLLLTTVGCARPADSTAELESRDSLDVAAEVEAALWAFHAADTARDAEGVMALLWPEYHMLVDGQRVGYEEVVASSREFMGSLDLFHTVWSDVRIIVIGSDAAVSSFLFRDSIVTRGGELTRARGPTTFLWERRADEWRLVFADADHYPISP